MELKSISGQVNIAQIANMKPSSGRISLPVSRSQSPYAQFKYVQGIPSNSPGNSLSINRLRVLDTLIHGLVEKTESSASLSQVKSMSDSSVKAMIDQYSSQIHQALKSASPFTAAGSAYSSGAVLNVFA